jgi:hypothetical protein
MQKHIDKITKMPGILYVRTWGLDGTTVDPGPDNDGLDATGDLADAVLRRLAGSPDLGPVRVVVGDFTILVVPHATPDYVEAIAVTFPTGHPVAKSLHRTIRRCWGIDKRTPPKEPSKYDSASPLGDARTVGGHS